MTKYHRQGVSRWSWRECRQSLRTERFCLVSYLRLTINVAAETVLRTSHHRLISTLWCPDHLYPHSNHLESVSFPFLRR